MPRKQRHVKRWRETAPLTPEEFERRARWGGLLGDLAALTEAQQIEWEAFRRGREEWHPQRALRYAWARIDAVHGLGGRCGTSSRRDGWCLDHFLDALAADRRDVEAVITTYPSQRTRLTRWLSAMAVLGRARAAAPHAEAGEWYQRLGQLGYDGTERPDEKDDAATTD
jgi:hypothetical protein